MQLFTHLLSSYLQGMGDFFSALPWGGPGRGVRRAGEGLSELGMASLPLPWHPYFFAKNFWKKRS